MAARHRAGSSRRATGGLPTEAPSPGPDGAAAPPANQCEECTTSADCTAGETCAQFQGRHLLRAPVPERRRMRRSTTCTSETSYAGDQVSVCVPNDSACGTSPPTSSGPSPPGLRRRGGYYLRLAHWAYVERFLYGVHEVDVIEDVPAQRLLRRLVVRHGDKQMPGASGLGSAPSGCSDGEDASNDGGTASHHVDAGGPVTGTVGASGGTVSRLYFTAVGDTRPANEDDTRRLPDGDHRSDLFGHHGAQPAAAVLGLDRRLPVREPDWHAVGAATRSVPRGARQVPRRVLPGDGKPRVHRGHRVELRLREHGRPDRRITTTS